MDICGKVFGVIEAFGAEVIPSLGLQNFRVNLALPQDFEGLPLGVVVDASQTNECGIA
jgi:hypothetical protein